MITLVKAERVDLVADENKLNEVQILWNREVYSMRNGACVSDPSKTALRHYLKEEAAEHIDEALLELKKWQDRLNKPVEIVEKEVVKEVPVESGLGSKLEGMLLKVLAEQSVDQVLEIAKPMLDEHIRETYGSLPKRVEVVTPTETKVVTGTTHEKFDKVLTQVAMDIPVFLSGPAGTGKNVICKQIAEGLGLDFYFTNSVTQEYQLKGFIDANGTYHATQFFEAFTKGGLFFLDEMDASIPETLVILNSAIANRYFDFPTGRVDAHPDFRIIAAGNTCGTGADIEYTGRFQLDAASLDRFSYVQIDYSPAIEDAITGGNTDLCKFARKFREICKETGIRCLFTYRSMDRISKLEKVMDLAEVLQMGLTKGLGKDDIQIIKNRFNFQNKYTEALGELCR